MIRVVRDVGIEERLDDDLKRQSRHVARQVSSFTGLPTGYRSLRVLHHHIAVRADPLPVKGGLGQASLASPEVALAGYQTISNQTMKERRAERPCLSVALRVRRQYRLDVGGVIKKVSVNVEKPGVNYVSVIPATRHKAERVAIEVAHHAHDWGTFRPGWNAAIGLWLPGRNRFSGIHCFSVLSISV